MSCGCFFFNDTATTEIYTLSLHDALPICEQALVMAARYGRSAVVQHLLDAGVDVAAADGMTALHWAAGRGDLEDRKSTRLNSSHANISYAVFCLKKKKEASSCTTTPTRVP